MRWPESHLRRWLDPLVFAIWTVFLVYLLISQRYIAFLRPEFGVLLALAHIIAMSFTLTAMVRSKGSVVDASAVLRSLVLLVPILYSLIMPGSMLGNQAFNKRFTGNAPGFLGRQKPSANASQGDQHRPDGLSSNQAVDIGQPEKPTEITILQLMLNPNLFNGKRVVVTGMIMRDAELKPFFGGLDTALYRFLITCCAADALPLAIALDGDSSAAFAKDQWVQVEGIFKLQHSDGKPFPMVSKPQIRPVEAPSMPYLY
jgi:putative membrane protein